MFLAVDEAQGGGAREKPCGQYLSPNAATRRK